MASKWAVVLSWLSSLLAEQEIQGPIDGFAATMSEITPTNHLYMIYT